MDHSPKNGWGGRNGKGKGSIFSSRQKTVDIFKGFQRVFGYPQQETIVLQELSRRGRCRLVSMEQKLIKRVTCEKERSCNPRWSSRRQAPAGHRGAELLCKVRENNCEEERLRIS